METGIPASAESIYRLLCVVASFQKRQDIIVESLYSHAQTVKRESGKHTHIFIGKVIGISLYGDFSFRIYIIIMIYSIENTYEIIFFQLGRCPSTEVYCVYDFTTEIIFPFGNLLA